MSTTARSAQAAARAQGDTAPLDTAGTGHEGIRRVRLRAFGLRIASSLACPELVADRGGDASADDIVRFEEGALPDEPFAAIPRDGWFTIRDGVLHFSIDRIGRFAVADGRDVRFSRDASVPPPGVTDADLRVFLLGSCLGAVLQQRGVLALHASCAVVDGAAVAFVGPSGAGKSTALASLLSDGHAMLSDDVCAIDLIGDEARVRPAYGQVKLHRDSAGHLSIERPRLGWINRFRDKHAIDCRERLTHEAVPLRAVLALEVGAEGQVGSVRPVHGAERFALLHRNTYRQQFHEGFGIRDEVAAAIAALANRVPVYRFGRPATLEAGDRRVSEAVYRVLEDGSGR